MIRFYGKKPPKQLVSGEKLFQNLLERMGYTPQVYAVFDIWDRLVSSRQGRVLGLKSTTLYVEVESNVHLHDFLMRKRQLIKEINQHFGKTTVVSDIIFQLNTTPLFVKS